MSFHMSSLIMSSVIVYVYSLCDKILWSVFARGIESILLIYVGPCKSHATCCLTVKAVFSASLYNI